MREFLHPYFVRRTTRRHLLAGLGAFVATAPAATTTLAQAVFARDPFTLGVASGDPLPDGVVLWTRLGPEPLHGGGMPMARVELAWEVARDARMREVVQRGTTMARPELGHAVHVEIGGLQPAREYWYRFTVERVSLPGQPLANRQSFVVEAGKSAALEA